MKWLIPLALVTGGVVLALRAGPPDHNTNLNVTNYVYVTNFVYYLPMTGVSFTNANFYGVSTFNGGSGLVETFDNGAVTGHLP